MLLYGDFPNSLSSCSPVCFCQRLMVSLSAFSPVLLKDNKVQHIQVCEGYEPHFTVFDWISKEQYKKLLSSHFDIEIKDDGKSSLYICKRR